MVQPIELIYDLFPFSDASWISNSVPNEPNRKHGWAFEKKMYPVPKSTHHGQMAKPRHSTRNWPRGWSYYLSAELSLRDGKAKVAYDRDVFGKQHRGVGPERYHICRDICSKNAH